MVAEHAENLQSLALIAQLGPGPEPGLGGVLDGLVCESECLGQLALIAQQKDQVASGGGGEAVVAASGGLVVGAAEQGFGFAGIHQGKGGSEFTEVFGFAGGLGDAPQ